MAKKVQPQPFQKCNITCTYAGAVNFTAYKTESWRDGPS